MCATNCGIAFAIFVEVIYLWVQLAICNHRHERGWNVDYEFVIGYLLGQPLQLLNIPGITCSVTGTHGSSRHVGLQLHSQKV